jgi:hypothetical protein
MKVDSATQAQAAVVASLKATKRFEKTNKRLMSRKPSSKDWVYNLYAISWETVFYCEWVLQI